VEKDDNPKHLHIDNFPEDVKKAARKKAMDTHPNFKSWVVDLFNAATTGEDYGGFRVVDSPHESGQKEVRRDSRQIDKGRTSEAIRNKARQKTKT
jgi:hypothetical protein